MSFLWSGTFPKKPAVSYWSVSQLRVLTILANLYESSLHMLNPCVRGILRYVYTRSDIFRFIRDRIHYGTNPICPHGTGSKLERYGSIWDHLHKWTNLVPDSRSDPYRIHHVLCPWTRVNERLVRTKLSWFQMDPVPCKRCLKRRHLIIN